MTLLFMLACKTDNTIHADPDASFSGHNQWRSAEGIDEIDGDNALHFESVYVAFYDALLANGETADLVLDTQVQDDGESAVKHSTRIVWPKKWAGQQIHQVLAQGNQDYVMLDGSIDEEPIVWEQGNYQIRCFHNRGSVFVLESGSKLSTKAMFNNYGQAGVKFKVGQLPDADIPVLSAQSGNEGFALWLRTSGELELVASDGNNDEVIAVIGADARDWNTFSLRFFDADQDGDMAAYNNGARWLTADPLEFEALLDDPDAALVVTNPEGSGVRLLVDDIYWAADGESVMPVNPVDWASIEPAAWQGTGWVVSADEVQNSQVPVSGELQDGTQYDMAEMKGAFAVDGTVVIKQMGDEAPLDGKPDPTQYCAGL